MDWSAIGQWKKAVQVRLTRSLQSVVRRCDGCEFDMCSQIFCF